MKFKYLYDFIPSINRTAVKLQYGNKKFNKNCIHSSDDSKQNYPQAPIIEASVYKEAARLCAPIQHYYHFAPKIRTNDSLSLE